MGHVPVEGEGEETARFPEPLRSWRFPRWAFPGSGERDGSGLLPRVSWDPRGGVRARVSASAGADLQLAHLA